MRAPTDQALHLTVKENFSGVNTKKYFRSMEVEDVKILKHLDGAKLTYRSLDSNFAAKLGLCMNHKELPQSLMKFFAKELLSPAKLKQASRKVGFFYYYSR